MEDEDFELNPFKNKTYKGWQLLKAIADGEIKGGSTFETSRGEIVYYDGCNLRFGDEEGKYYTERTDDQIFSCIYFELISDLSEETDIQKIEDIYINEDIKSIGISSTKNWTGRSLDIVLGNKINELIEAVKQLDNKIKEE